MGREAGPVNHPRLTRWGIGILVLAAILGISLEPVVAQVLRQPAPADRAGLGGNGSATPASPATATPRLPAVVHTLTATPTASPSATSSATATPVPPTATPTGTPTVTAVPTANVQLRTFHSATLQREMPYYIFLPPGYDRNTATRYPVLYMLHGMGGSYEEWASYGLLGRAHDMMTVGQIAPFIIVLPQGDQSFWVNHPGGPAWGTYVVRDIPAEIDSRFRTIPDRTHRALGGLSMGATAALTLALQHPEVFSIVGAHSPSIRTHATAPDFLANPADFDAQDPVVLYPQAPKTARTLQIWLDSGQQDGWFPRVADFHTALTQLGVPHTWTPAPGTHGGEYWSAHVMDYLRFYSRALTGVAPSP
jgi:enterochelin esterase-like enzyme